MAIIYSYPEVTSLQATDRFIISRFPSGSGEISNYNLDLDTLSSYINTGQATVIQVDDRVVTGASFNTGSGLLTLTRNGGDIPSVTTNLDGRYYLSSNPNSYTSNLGVVQSLTTNNSSGAATLVNGTLNIPQYSGGSGTDNYVDSGTYEGGTLTLERTGTLGDIDISGFLEIGTGATQALAGNTTTITQTQADNITANNLKVTFPGFGTTAGKALEGNTVIPAAYTNADVDAHLNIDSAGNNEVLSWTGSDYDWVAQSGGGSGTVTSVAATHAGDAFTATIGNVSTVNPSVDITLNGSSSQYIDGAGNLTTFPTIPTVPANIVETVTTTDGTFIDLTPDVATDGAVTITADLSATGTADNTTFLRGDNTWAVPSGGGGGVTSIIAGTGIGVDQSTGDVTITNTGSATGAYATLTRTFSGNELVNAFNGTAGDEILLVTVPAGYQGILSGDVVLYVDYSTGTTNYAGSNLSLRVNSITGANYVALSTTPFTNSSFFLQLTNGQTDVNQNIGNNLGENITLVSNSTAQRANFTAGDRDVTLSFTYRLINLNL